MNNRRRRRSVFKADTWKCRVYAVAVAVVVARVHVHVIVRDDWMMRMSESLSTQIFKIIHLFAIPQHIFTRVVFIRFALLGIQRTPAFANELAELFKAHSAEHFTQHFGSFVFEKNVIRTQGTCC